MGDTYADNPRSFGIASPVSSLDFNLLCRVLDPTESEATIWHKIIDRKSHIVLFYQIDHQSIKPKMSRCVRLTKDQIHGVREVLKPTVYLHDYEQPSSFVESIFGRNHISSLDELTEILKVVECLDLLHLGGTNNVELSIRPELNPAVQRLNAVLGQPLSTSNLSFTTSPSAATAGTQPKVEYHANEYMANEDPGLPQMGEDFDNTSSVYSHPEDPEAVFDIMPKLQAVRNGEDVRISPAPDTKKKTSTRKRKDSVRDHSPEVEDAPANRSPEERKFYWTCPGRYQVALRTGYNVFVYKTILDDLKKGWGPDKQTTWNAYARKLVLHLIGSWDNVLRNKKHRTGMVKYLGETTCQAISGHLEELFGVELASKEFVQKINTTLSFHEVKQRKS